MLSLLSYENGVLILKGSKYIHRKYVSGRNNITMNKPNTVSGLKMKYGIPNDGHKSNWGVRLLPRCKGKKLY